MTTKTVDRKKTMQVIVDSGLHQLLKEQAVRSKRSMRRLLEEHIVNILGVTNSKKTK